MDEDDDGNKLTVKSVKLPIFMGNHMDFHTWWLQFQVFATVWKFAEVIEQTSEADLPATASTTLSMNEEMQCKQTLVKKHNAIAFANLTMALDSPSLIGMLMRAQTMAWP